MNKVSQTRIRLQQGLCHLVRVQEAGLPIARCRVALGPRRAFSSVSATSSGRRKTVLPKRTTTPAARSASHRWPASSGDPAARLATR